MYTDTSRPNHLAHEVVDNSVDEALAGHCKKIDVTIYKDGSLEVNDDGRGMPVDIHPKEKIPGVELILTRLHAGGKFSNKNYQFSGGLHGVGVSVVNALSKNLEVWIRRGGKEYNMSFVGGKKRGKLEEVGKVGKANTGTTIRFWPDEQYFDTTKFSVRRRSNTRCAPRPCCVPGSRSRSRSRSRKRRSNGTTGGLEEYLLEAIGGGETLPAEPFSGSLAGNNEAVDWALVAGRRRRRLGHRELRQPDPDAQGGTHVNGLRTGPDQCAARVLRFPEPAAARREHRARGRLGRAELRAEHQARGPAVLRADQGTPVVARIRGVRRRRDQGQLLAVAQPAPGDRRPDRQLAIGKAQKRLKSAKKVVRKKVVTGPGAARQARRLHVAGTGALRDVPRRGRLGGRFGQAGARSQHAGDHAAARQDPEHLGSRHRPRSSASQEVHDISVALGVDPGTNDIDNLRYHKICILADADSDGLHIATLLCALFLRHFRELVLAGHVYVAMPPLYRIDVGKEVFYALDEGERKGILDRIEAEKEEGQGHGDALQGSRRDGSRAACARRR